MVTRRRFERLTLWLKVRCSTGWASGSYWLGYLDSNQGDDRVKVCCLTAWLYPKKMVEEGGFEPPNRKELSYSQPRLATSLPPRIWCRLKDLNPQPTDYKSVALPIELSRHKWWRLTGSNRWPSACKADALPTELNLHRLVPIYIIIYFLISQQKNDKNKKRIWSKYDNVLIYQDW